MSGGRPDEDNSRLRALADGWLERLTDASRAAAPEGEDEAEDIGELPVAVVWRAGWQTSRNVRPGPDEYTEARIHLTVGGPACWLEADIAGGAVSAARIVTSDWGRRHHTHHTSSGGELCEIAELLLGLSGE